MPNRYLPSALVDLIGEVRNERFSESSAEGKGDDESDDYVPEHRVLETMLKPEYRERLEDLQQQ